MDFIKLNDITYLSASQTNSINENDLSPYAEIKFKVADNVNDSNYHTKNGDAAYLEAGTRVYALKDYEPSFRLVVKRNGRFVIFESDTNPNAKKGADLLPIDGKVDYISVNSAMDGKTVLATISDPTQVNNLIEMILEAPVDQSSRVTGKEQYFLEFHLKDGTSTQRSFWLDTGIMIRGIKLPKEFTDAIRSALNKQFASPVEFSSNIGATFPNAQIKYEGFAPVLSRDRAIAIAGNSFQDGYHLKAEDYPVNATVALYTGPFMGPGGGTLTDVQVWIVVIKGLPFGDQGPADTRPFTSVSQLNFAINSKTGIIVHEVLSGRRIY